MNGQSYLAKLLNAALCGFMQSGTRPVCSCSAMNLCISSVSKKKNKKSRIWRKNCQFRVSHELLTGCYMQFNVPLTCWTDVSFRSHTSSNGCAAAGSKSFVYCRMPDDVVKQHLHMHEWYRKRPSSKYGCANASITDILLSCKHSKNGIKSVSFLCYLFLTRRSEFEIQLTGSKTNIWHKRWTASCVACELRV